MVIAQTWEDLNNEKLSEAISRSMVSGEEGTVARFHIKRGGIVGRHSHRSEQYTMILSGSLKLIFDDGEVVLGPGQLIVIPAHVPHSAEALEDTVDVDFFAPRREDWLTKSDNYLRSGTQK